MLYVVNQWDCVVYASVSFPFSNFSFLVLRRKLNIKENTKWRHVRYTIYFTETPTEPHVLDIIKETERTEEKNYFWLNSTETICVRIKPHCTNNRKNERLSTIANCIIIRLRVRNFFYLFFWVLNNFLSFKQKQKFYLSCSWSI